MLFRSERLTSDQIAVIDALIRRDLAAQLTPRRGDAPPAARFSQRLSDDERRNAGLAALSGPEIERLDALIAHSIEHFEQENRWMEETNFPPVGCHKQEHDSVLEIMREVRSRYLAGETDLGQKLAEELPHWFEHHVDTMDNMLARFMIAWNATPAPAAEQTPA